MIFWYNKPPMPLRKLIALSLAALLQLSGCGIYYRIVDWISPPRGDATLFYLPLDSDLKEPVTGETIESMPGVCRVEISWRTKSATALREMLRRKVPGDFRADAVRLKAVRLLDEEVLIDSRGAVRFGDGKEAQLRHNDIRNLETMMQNQVCRERKGRRS